MGPGRTGAPRCAEEQGKFWPYHDKLFAGPARSDAARLKTYADDVALDAAAFDECIRTSRYQSTIQADIESGRRLGVTGTPTFFINGRMLVGAVPLEKFVELVDSELASRNVPERGDVDAAAPAPSRTEARLP